MAARSSSTTGMWITVAILGVLSLGLLITTLVFLSNANDATRRLAERETELSETLRPEERNRDDVNRLRDAAQKARQSLVGYLADSYGTAMQRITGNKLDTTESMEAALANIPGVGSGSLLAALRDRDSRLQNLESRLAAAEDARNKAQADLENEARRVKAVEDAFGQTQASLTAEVDQYKDQVEKFRDEVNQAKARMDQEIDRIRAGARDREAELTAQVRDLQGKEAIATDTIRRLQEQLRGVAFKGEDEFALVDGQIVGDDRSANTFFINIGRKNKARLGLAFEVYSDAAALKPDASGNYPRGKATVEVIRVDDNASTVRVVRSTRGNPIAKGDVIANPLFDPNKQYTFLVFGNFDSTGLAGPTPQGKADIEALIREWGGKTTDTLSGNIDFLVLGERPVLPPQPGIDAPPAVVGEFVRQRDIVRQYDTLREQAVATSIPILNQNRLRTLLGVDLAQR